MARREDERPDKRAKEAREDLEELIRANGEDIEFEFQLDGKIFQSSQTILELVSKLKRDRRQPGYGPEQITIRFSIKDPDS